MDTLDYKEMAILVRDITDRLTKELYTANRLGILEETLMKHNLKESKEVVSSSYYMPNPKILILGAVNSKINDIKKIFKNIGINPDRVEFIEDFEKLTNFNVEKLRNNLNYSDILVCAIPHKMKNIGKYPNVISLIEDNQEEFPLLTRITNERGELKFSINGLRKAIFKTKIYEEI